MGTSSDLSKAPTEAVLDAPEGDVALIFSVQVPPLVCVTTWRSADHSAPLTSGLACACHAWCAQELDELLARSQASNKVVVLFCALTWCRPCKGMQRPAQKLAAAYRDSVRAGAARRARGAWPALGEPEQWAERRVLPFACRGHRLCGSSCLAMPTSRCAGAAASSRRVQQQRRSLGGRWHPRHLHHQTRAVACASLQTKYLFKKRFKIRSTPAFIMFKNSEVVYTQAGSNKEKLEAGLRSVLADHPALPTGMLYPSLEGLQAAPTAASATTV